MCASYDNHGRTSIDCRATNLVRERMENTMQYARLGRAGIRVSRLALGTMNFGWHTEESTAHTIMDAALDAGINFFDTANIYSGGAARRSLAAGSARTPAGAARLF